MGRGAENLWRIALDDVKVANVNTDVLFCGTDLAARIERAETQLIVAATHAAASRGADVLAVPVAGGYACFAEPHSPLNKVVGLGFDGVPDTALLGEVEHMMAERGAATQVELSTLADPAIAAMLTARGYHVAGFEDILGRVPTGDEQSVPGVEVRRADDLTAWVNVVVDGFAHPDGVGVPSHEEFPRDVIERVERDLEKAGATAYIALCEGVVAGGGSARFADGIAQLAGAATAPAYRRRGVQTALLAARLTDAAAAGCDIAVVTTAPGSQSQQNVQRRAFQLLYTRAVLVKAPG
ncbi:GNAT family acetyltransferase [Mycolicibacterium brisbanense]|uniref:GNAT family acetyltransferase n=1 Tax=Mycolicibacterium brisbanense TaxID=146020 RepID=A0A100VZ73_9MYCO|nr:GNAT family acetyltransferase [Mycolicibacterium brisbanense]